METVFIYSRKQAIEDGYQVQLPEELTKEAGIKFPVYVTEAVYNKYLVPPKEMENFQDFSGRVWDVLTMFKWYAKNNPKSIMMIQVVFQMPNKNDWEKHEKRVGNNREIRTVTLKVEIGAKDFDDPAPAITISKPNEY